MEKLSKILILSLIFLLPLVLVINLTLYSIICEQLSSPSSISVLFGTLNISTGLFLNYLLVKFIIKKIKNK